ncbi:MAG: phosphatidate cytidylyltransferase [Kiritimatiellia bacterium]
MASKKRVICGLSVAAVWLLAIFVLPFCALAGLVMLSALVCVYEYCAMLKKAGYVVPLKTLIAASVLWFLWAYVRGPSLVTHPMTLLIAGGLGGLLFLRVLLDRRIAKPMETAAFTVCGFFYLPFMLSFFLLVAMCPWSGVAGYSAGIFLAFFIALIIKMSDTGGYFIGSAYGKHKLSPRLSPGKSWEGVAGGIVFALAVTVLTLVAAQQCDANFLNAFRQFDTPFRMAWLFVGVIITVVVGIFGDLLESLFKRACGVKDSSALFPAMGGFFDTFDSLIFAPATFLAWVWLMP